MRAFSTYASWAEEQSKINTATPLGYLTLKILMASSVCVRYLLVCAENHVFDNFTWAIS
jgi:hypothetical protein